MLNVRKIDTTATGDKSQLIACSRKVCNYEFAEGINRKLYVEIRDCNTMGIPQQTGQSLEPKISRIDIVELLSSTEMFGGLDEAVLRDVEAQLEWSLLPGGEILMRQGEPGDSMYILLHGRLHVAVERGGGMEDVVAEVGRGETVGEMAILTDMPRSATVRAIRDSELVRFSQRAFNRIVERHPDLLKRIVRLLGDRLRQTVQRKASHLDQPATFAVMAAGSGAPLSDFCHFFAERCLTSVRRCT